MDVHSPEQRSYNMSMIKCKNTKPELLVRKWLWAQGYRYRLHRKDLPGKPDIVFPKIKKVIFVHGCFWHKHNCKYFRLPKTNTDFWEEKISENVRRDQQHYQALIAGGWDYFIIWGCELKTKSADIFDNLKLFLESGQAVTNHFFGHKKPQR